MQTRQSSTHQSLRDVNAFLTDHADRLGDIPGNGAAARLRACLAKLDAHDNQQSSHSVFARSSSRRSNTLRRALLRHHMAPIARIAAVEMPHAEELLPLRLPRLNSTYQAIVSAARAMATVAKVHEALFIGMGLPSDFIERLTAVANDLQSSLDERGKNSNLSKGATAGIRASLRDARRAVRVLDSLVRIVLDDDPALLTTWNAARAVRKVGVRNSAARAEVVAQAIAANQDSAVTAAA